MLFNAKFRLIFYPFFFLALPIASYLLDLLVFCNEPLFDQLAWCDENSNDWLRLFRQSLVTAVIIGIIDFLSYLLWFRKSS